MRNPLPRGLYGTKSMRSSSHEVSTPHRDAATPVALALQGYHGLLHRRRPTDSRISEADEFCPIPRHGPPQRGDSLADADMNQARAPVVVDTNPSAN
jgi:hypothetical protein